MDRGVGCGSGSLVFPARPPRPWPSPAGPSRTSRVRRPHRNESRRGRPPCPSPPLRSALATVGAPRDPPRSEDPLGTWAPPLLRFVHFAPLRRTTRRASTPPDPKVWFGADAAKRRHPVPSSWFLTTSTVSSARRLRACCIPLTAMRFTAFRVAACRSEDLHAVTTLPAVGLTPYEEFPSPAAAPRHHGRCPPAVTRPDGAGDASRDTRCQVAQPTSPHRGGRLQSLAPLTSPLPSRYRCQ
jgi:hypothetical protein